LYEFLSLAENLKALWWNCFRHRSDGQETGRQVFVKRMSGVSGLQSGAFRMGWGVAIAFPVMFFPSIVVGSPIPHMAQFGSDIPMQGSGTPAMPPASLPETVKVAVLQAASTQIGIPSDRLTVGGTGTNLYGCISKRVAGHDHA
jgi:hypothetical protein